MTAKFDDIANIIQLTDAKIRDDWFYDNYALLVVNWCPPFAYDFLCWFCYVKGLEASLHVKTPKEAIRHATRHRQFRRAIRRDMK